MGVALSEAKTATEKGRVGEIRAATHHERRFADGAVEITQRTRDGGKDFIYKDGGSVYFGEAKNLDYPTPTSVVEEIVEVANKEGGKPALHSESGLTNPARKFAEKESVRVTTGDDISYSDSLYRLYKYSNRSLNATGSRVKSGFRYAFRAAKKRPFLAALVGLLVIVGLYVLYRIHFKDDNKWDALKRILPYRLFTSTVKRYRQSRESYKQSRVSNYVPWPIALAVGGVLAVYVLTTVAPILRRAR